MRLRQIAVLMITLVGCQMGIAAPDADPNRFFETEPEPPPATPILEPLPAVYPYDTVYLHGRAPGARQVIVEGSYEARVASVGTDGRFCAAVPAPVPALYDLQVYGLNTEGLRSRAAASAQVTVDLGAADNGNIQDCFGGRPSNGSPNPAPGCGQVVNGCQDCDALEFNNDTMASAPRILPGRHDNLELCPGTDDYYRIPLRTNEVLIVRLFFHHPLGNLDLQVLQSGHNFGSGEAVPTSSSTNDDEFIEYHALVQDDYRIRVFSTTGEGNTYSLEIEKRVFDPPVDTETPRVLR